MKIIVEGLWAIGKTSLCTLLKDSHNFTFINEPDHREQILKIDDLDNWYYQEHVKSLRSAISLETSVVWERCFISTLAYEKAISVRESRIQRSDDEHELFDQIDKVIFMEVDIDNYMEYLNSKRIPALEGMGGSKLRSFLKIYQDELKKYCEEYCIGAMLCRKKIVLDSDADYFSNLNKIVELCIKEVD